MALQVALGRGARRSSMRLEWTTLFANGTLVVSLCLCLRLRRVSVNAPIWTPSKFSWQLVPVVFPRRGKRGWGLHLPRTGASSMRSSKWTISASHTSGQLGMLGRLASGSPCPCHWMAGLMHPFGGIPPLPGFDPFLSGDVVLSHPQRPFYRIRLATYRRTDLGIGRAGGL